MASAKRTAARSTRGTGPSSGEASDFTIPAAFERIAAAMRREGGIDPAVDASRRRFGSGALKVGGKIFAMPAQDTLVLKLPASRVDALVAAGLGLRFDPGSGKIMKEWIALRGAEAQWLELAREARDFVRAGTR